MGLFDRFRKSSSNDDTQADTPAAEAVDTAKADDSAQADLDTTAAHVDEDDEFVKEAPRDRAEKGPWDESEAALEGNRIDLGSLRIPVYDGMQVQLEADEKTSRVMAVSLVHKGGNLQLQAFAAPKTEGLWATVRAQISQNITKSGGTAQEIFSSLGNEISAAVPVKLPDGKVGTRPVRFAGVDGPRWFLRGVFTNKAVSDEKVRAELVEVMRGTIVVRGEEPMPPREVLTLTPPRSENEAPAEKTEDINPFKRGPEIAEVR